jgi:hypothetical protein
MGRLHKIDNLTRSLRSVSSLNNPQNSEMKFCENMKLVDMLKIIIIIVSSATL